MVTRYLCLNCENRFEHDSEKDKKLRCPKCMRLTGLEKLADPKAKPQSPPWLVPAAIGGALVVLLGGYAWWRSAVPTAVEGDVPLRPLDASETEGYLRASGGDGEPMDRLFASSDALESFAEEHGDGANNQAVAASVLGAMRQLAEDGRFARWSLGVPRETAPAVASVAFESVREEDDTPRHMYPLELATIMAVALRARGVPAMVAEVFRFPNDDAPPDPSGHFGYFGVAVYDEEAGEGDPTIYDPWGGHEAPPEEDDFEVLNDLEAIGAALSLRAIHLLVRESDAERALAASTDAIRLCPRSPAVRSVRGAILLASGNTNEAIAEFESAKDLRADGPRHNLLAGVYLAQSELESAQREVSAALEEFPDYAGAHATLAALHMANAEPEDALDELGTAERLDADLHILPGLYANYYAGTGDLDRAVEYARRAIDANPADLQARLMAARIFRQAARYDDMRREARAVLEATPEARRDQMEDLIHELLGPSALDEDEEDELTDEEVEAILAEDDDTARGEFDLSSGSRLLGGEGSLLDDDDDPLGAGDDHPGPRVTHDDAEDDDDEGAGSGSSSGGPTIMLGDPDDLSLGGGGRRGRGGDRLRLDLGGE